MSFMWPTCLILQPACSHLNAPVPIPFVSPCPAILCKLHKGRDVCRSVCWCNPRSKAKASYMKLWPNATCPRVPSRPCLILTHSCLMSTYDSYRHFSGLSPKAPLCNFPFTCIWKMPFKKQIYTTLSVFLSAHLTQALQGQAAARDLPPQYYIFLLICGKMIYT